MNSIVRNVFWGELICLSLFLASCSDDSEPVCTLPISTKEMIYQVAQLTINTENAAPIMGKDKKDYVNCNFIIDSEIEEWDYNGTGRIRGRGNSTWLWYPKKPYRIKLDKKSEILGLATEKDWVLLANYRDPTHMMNTFTFIAGEKLGLPYTNHSRYVEVTLNGEYIGLYQLTEQVEQGSSRVAVDDEQGMLISLDATGIESERGRQLLVDSLPNAHLCEISGRRYCHTTEGGAG